MRFALIAVALFAASASASVVFRRQQFPSCATNCVNTTSPGSCTANDDACLCKSTPYLTALAACFQQACQGADLTAAEQTGAAYCLQVGVTLSGAPTGSVTAPVSTPAASGSASVTKAASSSVTKAASSSVTKPASSTATKPATSSVASVSKPAVTSASGSGATPASSSSGSAPPASSSTSAGSIIGVSAFAGLAAFGLATLLRF